jgi:hypothetical protein
VFGDRAARNESRVRKKKLRGIRRRSQSLSTLSHRNLNVTPRIGTFETCRPTSSMFVGVDRK